MTSSTGRTPETGPRGVVVTGGGSGIGRATAQKFAGRGDSVLIVGRGEPALAETAKGHDQVHILPVDLTAPGTPEIVVEAALRLLGRVDVLVNNAAVSRSAMLADVTPAHLEEQFAINVVAPTLLTRAALDAISETRGTIVNVSTAGSLGLRTWPGFSVFGASKVALEFLTRTWAVELAPRGVRVLGVAPGVVDTGVGLRMGMSREQYDAFLDDMGGKAPAGRVGTPEEIGQWIAQLAAPQSAYATGIVVAVDGGLSLT